MDLKSIVLELVGQEEYNRLAKEQYPVSTAPRSRRTLTARIIETNGYPDYRSLIEDFDKNQYAASIIYHLPEPSPDGKTRGRIHYLVRHADRSCNWRRTEVNEGELQKAIAAAEKNPQERGALELELVKAELLGIDLPQLRKEGYFTKMYTYKTGSGIIIFDVKMHASMADAFSWQGPMPAEQQADVHRIHGLFNPRA